MATSIHPAEWLAHDFPGLVLSARPECSDSQSLSALGRGLARHAVSKLLGISGEDIDITRLCACGDHPAKPRVTTHAASISISHCPSLVVAVATRAGHVGIDVEPVTDRDLRGVGRRVLGPFDDTDPEDSEAILRAWVRKEAVAKATGDGLYVAFPSVGVGGGASIGPDIPYDGGHVEGQLRDLDLGPGHLAAVALLWQLPSRLRACPGRGDIPQERAGITALAQTWR